MAPFTTPHILRLACLGLFASLTLPQSQASCSLSYPSLNDAIYAECAVLADSSTLAWTWNDTLLTLNGVYMSAPSVAGGWIAWGFNHDGKSEMVNSSVLACFADDRGLVLGQYFLEKPDFDGVYLGSVLNVTSASCVSDSSTIPETLYIQFSIVLGYTTNLIQVYGNGEVMDKRLGPHMPNGTIAETMLREFKAAPYVPPPTSLPFSPASPPPLPASPLSPLPPPPSLHVTSCQYILAFFSTMEYTFCTTFSDKSYLVWKFENSSNIFDGLFVATPRKPGGWVAWGLNLFGRSEMVGSSVLACYRGQEGSPIIDQYYLEGYSPESVYLDKKGLDFTSQMCQIDSSTNLETITMQFSIDFGDVTSWKSIHAKGDTVLDYAAKKLGQHCSDCYMVDGELRDFGVEGPASSKPAHASFKYAHGALSAIGWGIFIPVGGMIARYGKPFTEEMWFYVHVPCQFFGYVVGAIGFALGLKLWSWTKRGRDIHAILGIVVFCLGTLQGLVVFLKPEKGSPARLVWTLYHSLAGHATIAIGVANVLVGFHVLEGSSGPWRSAYIALLATLGGLALILEAVLWVLFFLKRAKNHEEHTRLRKPNDVIIHSYSDA